MREYKIPPRFFADHVSRGLIEKRDEVRSTKTYIVVRLTAEQYAELLSDAEHYVALGEMGALDSYYNGLVASARATVKALVAQA